MKTKTDNTSQKKKFNGRYLLLLVLFAYTLLYYYFPDKTTEALSKSLSTMLHLLPVFLVVIVLMGIFTTLMNAKELQNFWESKVALKGGLLQYSGVY